MAAKTKAALATDIATLLADNTAGNISEADLRQIAQDTVDSLQNQTEADALYAGAAHGHAIGEITGTTAFLQSEKDKLAGLESSKWLGTYSTLSALQTANPTPVEGSYGDVDAGVGSAVTRYIWDNDDSAFVAQVSTGGAGTDTDAIHKTTAGEIAAIAEKTVLVGTDILLGEDSEAGNAKVRFNVTDLLTSIANAVSLSVHVNTNKKTTPLDDDLLVSADPDNASDALKEFGTTWLNGWLNYFKVKADVLYQPKDANILKATTADTLEVGFDAVSFLGGVVTTGVYTPAAASGNFQHYTNGGAHTLAPPINPCTIIIQCTNNASAGVITTTGFAAVDGDALTVTDGDDFMFYITKTNDFSYLSVKALQ